jgi:hypothetical protein
MKRSEPKGKVHITYRYMIKINLEFMRYKDEMAARERRA